MSLKGQTDLFSLLLILLLIIIIIITIITNQMTVSRLNFHLWQSHVSNTEIPLCKTIGQSVHPKNKQEKWLICISLFVCVIAAQSTAALLYSCSWSGCIIIPSLYLFGPPTHSAYRWLPTMHICSWSSKAAAQHDTHTLNCGFNAIAQLVHLFIFLLFVVFSAQPAFSRLLHVAAEQTSTSFYKPALSDTVYQLPS